MCKKIERKVSRPIQILRNIRKKASEASKTKSEDQALTDCSALSSIHFKMILLYLRLSYYPKIIKIEDNFVNYAEHYN